MGTTAGRYDAQAVYKSVVRTVGQESSVVTAVRGTAIGSSFPGHPAQRDAGRQPTSTLISAAVGCLSYRRGRINIPSSDHRGKRAPPGRQNHGPTTPSSLAKTTATGALSWQHVFLGSSDFSNFASVPLTSGRRHVPVRPGHLAHSASRPPR